MPVKYVVESIMCLCLGSWAVACSGAGEAGESAAPGETPASAAGGAGAGGSSAGSATGARGAGLDGSGSTASGAAGSPTGGSASGGASHSESLTAVEMAAAMGRGFNVGNTYDRAQQPSGFDDVRAKIDAYYDKGFRNVRIPITWTEEIGGSMLVHDAETGEVNRDHPRLEVIAEIVDYALSLDMVVVINAHHEKALKTNARSAVLQRLWSDIADIFGDRSQRLLFEILNEPHKSDASNSAMAPGDLRYMTGLAYDEIRAVDPKRIILIGGNQWFHASEMAKVWKNLDAVGGGDDPYVMATFHHYDPWSFCGDNQGSYDDAWNESSVLDPMKTMQAWANSVGQGMPVYIGEWGVGWGSRYGQMTCNNIRAWYTELADEAAPALGMPTSVWDDGGWFQVFNNGSESFQNNLVDCIWGSCSWDGDQRFNAGCQ